jgi:DMSO reductase family type II enzyme heme b subunit
MKRWNVFYRESVYVWAGIFLFTLLAIGPACFPGCRRSSQPADQRKAINDATNTAADSSPRRPLEKPAAETPGSQAMAGVPQKIGPQESGQQLYARHCAACHGERGDGQGLAAAFLFPKPRDFRSGKFRLISTSNNVPTRDDLQAVLLRGMPGSAMPSWVHLAQQERDAIVDEILRLRVEGAQEVVVNQIKEDEGMSDEEIAASAEAQQAIEEEVRNATTPGEGRAVPAIGPTTEEAIARGKINYAKFVCVSCHGETGRGDGVQEMQDDEKLPTRPRDFTLGVFKGNPDPASLYRRIAFGMPGTPMPSSSSMTPEQMIDLVHYIRSLSSEEQRQAAVATRGKLVAKRLPAIPSSAGGDWSQVPAIRLHVTPLWWRTDADANFQVQVAHDGRTLALRLSWSDTTPNLESLHSESFKDAVAVEVYRGLAEPFLGMGSADSPVDVWFWDADRQNELAAVEQSHPNAVADVYPFNEASVASAELSRPAGRMAAQPAIAFPARSVGNQIVPPANGAGGSALQAAGPRTLTFHVPTSQIVQAHGTWADGRWMIVMTRPLAVNSSQEGVSLEPGSQASIAFALWDGSHQDRNGQKSITIWQDLEIEK